MADFVGREIEEIAATGDSQLESLPITYAAVGGTRVTSAKLAALRDSVREIARAAGYPARRTTEAQQRFDRATMLLLRELPGLEPGEAIRDDVWQFVAVGLLPDVVFWRWADESGLNPDRYLGGNRNTFGRLWQRGFIFWDDRLITPDEPIKQLLEDNYAALLERSAFAANPDPVRECARAFLLRRHLARTAERYLRDAMRRVTRLTGYAALWAIDPADLQRQVARAFDDALRAAGGVPAPEGDLVARQPGLGIRSDTATTGQTVPKPSVAVAMAIKGSASAPMVAAQVPTPVPATEMHFGDQLEASFSELSHTERTGTVWRILVGRGEQSEEDLIRIAAHELRARGQLSFERLREGGTIFRMIEDAIERGVRSGLFDKPTRGSRRAVAQSIGEVPNPVVRLIVREAIAEGIVATDALPVVVNDLRRRIGLANTADARPIVERTLAEMKSDSEIVEESGLLQIVESCPLESPDFRREGSDHEASPIARALKLAAQLGIDVVDRTSDGDGLWFSADAWRSDLVSQLRSLKLSPRFYPHGSRLTGWRPAWRVDV